MFEFGGNERLDSDWAAGYEQFLIVRYGNVLRIRTTNFEAVTRKEVVEGRPRLLSSMLIKYGRINNKFDILKIITNGGVVN